MSESLSGQPSDASASNLNDSFAKAVGEAPFALSQEPVTPEGAVADRKADEAPAPAYEHLGDLPASYGTQSVYLVAYDPRQLFVYWDIDWKTVPNATYHLRVCRPDGQVETQVEISVREAGRYLEAAVPQGTYYVELGRHGRDGGWQTQATSGRVTMPPPGLSSDIEPKFATLPFHLSFQRLLELIQNAMGGSGDLTGTLARLQQGDQAKVSSLLGTLSRLSGDQLHTLEGLLGQRFAGASDTQGVGGGPTSVFRDRHDALAAGGLGSEARLAGGSETLASGGFGSEALSSVGTMGSETLASGGFGSETMLGGLGGSEILASGALSSGELPTLGSLNSEWLSSGAFGSEALSSYTAGPNSEVWRLAAGSVGSDTMDSERAAMFLHAVEHNLDILGSLFSAFGSNAFGLGGASDGFSAGGW